ncbi:partial Hydrogen cyanide synthase subunit HcnB, partial [Anaerolineae bacterium]
MIDEGRVSGGQIYRRQPEGFRRRSADLYGFEAAKADALHRDFDALGARIDYRPESLAWNVYDGALHVLNGQRTEALRYDALILATGATDRLVPLPGWTKPGVYSLGGAQIALKAQACAIGTRPIFLGTGPLLYLVAYQYARAGVKPAAVLDTSAFRRRVEALPLLVARPDMLFKGTYYSAWLAAHRVTMLAGVTPIAIESRGEGEERVAGVAFQDGSGRLRRVEGDAVGMGYGLRSETQLADLAHCDFAFDPVARQYLPVTDADGRSSAKGVY